MTAKPSPQSHQQCFEAILLQVNAILRCAYLVVRWRIHGVRLSNGSALVLLFVRVWTMRTRGQHLPDKYVLRRPIIGHWLAAMG
jgi:hypothetical protein